MIRRFLQLEAASGIILAACTAVALLLANGPLAESYSQLLHGEILGLSLHHWINDGLMTIFFFVVGMEIKSQLLEGELSSARKAALPILAAIGGMLFPAVIYYALNPRGSTSHGWGIPMATDIAFAVGVLSIFGKRVPLALKIFLLALAIVDDLGAVLVIAIFYTGKIHFLYLAAAGAIFCLMALLRSLGVRARLAYVPFGALAWLCFLLSGVHATIAGVVLGLITPLRLGNGSSPLHDLVKTLHPYVNFLIMPVFALANAGVDLRAARVGEMFGHPVTLGVACGLLFGKPVGIFLLSRLGVAARIAELPRGVGWGQLFGVGILGGIGFTMALFIGGLALPEELQNYAKVGILEASLLAAGAGSAVLAAGLRR